VDEREHADHRVVHVEDERKREAVKQCAAALRSLRSDHGEGERERLNLRAHAFDLVE
jgi:CRISPR/Cas system CMR subunit Cmr4 (Cas7 group RAMP superfamily)